MKKLVTGECNSDNIFHLVDPTAFVEIDFEAEVVKALTCLQPDYWCGVFAGTFVRICLPGSPLLRTVVSHGDYGIQSWMEC